MLPQPRLTVGRRGPSLHGPAFLLLPTHAAGVLQAGAGPASEAEAQAEAPLPTPYRTLADGRKAPLAGAHSVFLRGAHSMPRGHPCPAAGRGRTPRSQPADGRPTPCCRRDGHCHRPWRAFGRRGQPFLAGTGCAQRQGAATGRGCILLGSPQHAPPRAHRHQQHAAALRLLQVLKEKLLADIQFQGAISDWHPVKAAIQVRWQPLAACAHRTTPLRRACSRCWPAHRRPHAQTRWSSVAGHAHGRSPYSRSKHARSCTVRPTRRSGLGTCVGCDVQPPHAWPVPSLHLSLQAADIEVLLVRPIDDNRYGDDNNFEVGLRWRLSGWLVAGGWGSLLGKGSVDSAATTPGGGRLATCRLVQRGGQAAR